MTITQREMEDLFIKAYKLRIALSDAQGRMSDLHKLWERHGGEINRDLLLNAQDKVGETKSKSVRAEQHLAQALQNWKDSE